MADKTRRSFELPTEGKQPAIDAMSIIVTLLDELPNEEVAGWLGYLEARADHILQERARLTPAGDE